MDEIALIGMPSAGASPEATPERNVELSRALNQAERLGDENLRAALSMASSSQDSRFLTLLGPPEDAGRRGSRGEELGSGRMCPDLYNAATKGDKTRVVQLLESGLGAHGGAHGRCSLREVTAETNTVLHIAAGLGHMVLATEVCRRDRSLLLAENARRDTPLHCAARAGHGSMVSLILSHADVSQAGGLYEVLTKRNSLEETALHAAARSGHGTVAQVLMTVAPRLSTMVNSASVSALYMAVVNKSVPVVKALIQYDHASHAGPHGQTALHAAVLSSEEIVQMLLKTSASAAYLKDEEGLSPIHVAARVGNIDVIKLILKACPDSAEILDNEGRNFLHIAAENKMLPVVEYVLREKELEKLINEQDFRGNTPLHLAVKSENSRVVVELLQYKKIQTSIMNNEGRTPLGLASGITGLLPLAGIVSELTYRGAAFSVKGQDQGETLKKVLEKWYSDVSKNLAIVSVLIATVAFSAAFNLPGGYNSKGTATLEDQLKFKIFMVLDSIAMTFSMVSTILLILVRAIDVQDRFLLFVMAIFFLWVSIFGMSVAFLVAAWIVSLKKWIIYLAYFIFYIPILGVGYENSPAIIILRLLRKSEYRPPTGYTSQIAKRLFGKALCLPKALAIVILFTYFSACIVLGLIIFRF